MCVCGDSGEESAVVGEGGEGSASEGEPAGGPPAEAGGAAAEGRETPSPAGGKAEAKIGEEQGQNLQTARLNLDLKSQSQKSAGTSNEKHKSIIIHFKTEINNKDKLLNKPELLSVASMLS